MEEKRLKEDLACYRENAGKQRPHTFQDIRKKLTLIKKNVDDLQQQRKIAYKNSVKVKRMIHNQINQIVKCLRSRERCLWSEVDDAYLSQDENISKELLRLQTIYSNCQTLFDDLEGNPQNLKALSKIYRALVQVNCEEKSNGKALEFSSEFETLKTVAAEFGNLTGDFCKKDEFVIIDEDCSSNITCESISNNREPFKTGCEKNIGEEDSSDEYLSINTEGENLFEVISFKDNVICEDFYKDFHMVDQDNFEKVCQKVQHMSLFHRIGNKLKNSEESEKDFHMVDQDNYENVCGPVEYMSLFHKDGNKFKNSNKFENPQNTPKEKDFDAEEEWRQLFELKSKVSSICGMLQNESSSSGNKNATSNNLNAKKSSSEFVYLSPNEVNDWLPQKRARKDKVLNKCTWQSKNLFGNRDGLLKKNFELEKNENAKSCDRSQINSRCKLSPAESVRSAFSKYFIKDGIENWLSRY